MRRGGSGQWAASGASTTLLEALLFAQSSAPHHIVRPVSGRALNPHILMVPPTLQVADGSGTITLVRMSAGSPRGPGQPGSSLEVSESLRLPPASCLCALPGKWTTPEFARAADSPSAEAVPALFLGTRSGPPALLLPCSSVAPSTLLGGAFAPQWLPFPWPSEAPWGHRPIAQPGAAAVSDALSLAGWPPGSGEPAMVVACGESSSTLHRGGLAAALVPSASGACTLPGTPRVVLALPLTGSSQPIGNAPLLLLLSYEAGERSAAVLQSADGVRAVGLPGLCANAPTLSAAPLRAPRRATTVSQEVKNDSSFTALVQATPCGIYLAQCPPPGSTALSPDEAAILPRALWVPAPSVRLSAADIYTPEKRWSGLENPATIMAFAVVAWGANLWCMELIWSHTGDCFDILAADSILEARPAGGELRLQQVSCVSLIAGFLQKSGTGSDAGLLGLPPVLAVGSWGDYNISLLSWGNLSPLLSVSVETTPRSIALLSVPVESKGHARQESSVTHVWVLAAGTADGMVGVWELFFDDKPGGMCSLMAHPPAWARAGTGPVGEILTVSPGPKSSPAVLLARGDRCLLLRFVRRAPGKGSGSLVRVHGNRVAGSEGLVSLTLVAGGLQPLSTLLSGGQSADRLVWIGPSGILQTGSLDARVQLRWDQSADCASRLRALAYHSPSRCIVALAQLCAPTSGLSAGISPGLASVPLPGSPQANHAPAGTAGAAAQHSAETPWELQLYHAGSLACVASLPLPAGTLPAAGHGALTVASLCCTSTASMDKSSAPVNGAREFVLLGLRSQNNSGPSFESAEPADPASSGVGELCVLSIDVSLSLDRPNRVLEEMPHGAPHGVALYSIVSHGLCRIPAAITCLAAIPDLRSDQPGPHLLAVGCADGVRLLRLHVDDAFEGAEGAIAAALAAIDAAPATLADHSVDYSEPLYGHDPPLSGSESQAEVSSLRVSTIDTDGEGDPNSASASAAARRAGTALRQRTEIEEIGFSCLPGGGAALSITSCGNALGVCEAMGGAAVLAISQDAWCEVSRAAGSAPTLRLAAADVRGEPMAALWPLVWSKTQLPGSSTDPANSPAPYAWVACSLLGQLSVLRGSPREESAFWAIQSAMRLRAAEAGLPRVPLPGQAPQPPPFEWPPPMATATAAATLAAVTQQDAGNGTAPAGGPGSAAATLTTATAGPLPTLYVCAPVRRLSSPVLRFLPSFVSSIPIRTHPLEQAQCWASERFAAERGMGGGFLAIAADGVVFRGRLCIPQRGPPGSTSAEARSARLRLFLRGSSSKNAEDPVLQSCNLEEGGEEEEEEDERGECLQAA